jgi:hypothetical protein
MTGRKKIVIDPETVKRLAQIMCTMEEMAHICKCSVDTLERRFADVIKEGRASGKMSLRRWQWEACKKGNSALLIWMGKQHLGQKDKQEISGADGGAIAVTISADDANL